MTVETLITDHIDIWSSALQTRSTAGRGSSGKIDLYGMKKLRELILELAVRGKLVPQDPNDEPASELLKRIAAEKAELVKQGKIKKQKPLPEISEDEKPFELPAGWEWARLGEIAEIIRGVTYGKVQSSEIKKEGMLPLLRANNIQSEILIEPLVYVDENLVSSEQYLRTGDVLIAMSSGSESLVGKAAQFFEDGNYTFGAFCSVVRSYSKKTNEFMGFFLKTPLYRGQTKTSGKGIGIKNLNKLNLEMLLVAIPSESNSVQLLEEATFLLTLCDQMEQQSLTSKYAHQQLVETLLATLTDSKSTEQLAENWVRISQHFDTLFTTEASIDALKQTILQLAVMGKLVPQDPNDEPASELLKRIEQEKAQLVKDGKIKKQKPLPPVSDEEKPFELPVGWEWIRFGEVLGELKYGTSQKCDYLTNGYPVLRIPNVVGGEVSLEDIKFGKLSENELKELSLEKDDLIFIRSNGSLSIVGQCTLLRQSLADYAYAGYLIRARVFNYAVCAEYISLIMKTVLIREQIERPIRTTTGVKNINYSELSNLKLALPPISMQKIIVEKINVLLNVCDTLKSRLQSAQESQLYLADALTDAALK
ncbi:restriction endonuclease subunit S [Serratia rubidaea]|uniref:Type I restriction enzyme EcoKI specificity protein n=1 Tax=Serratia rubidaea TaxID=61652 RepID=A0A3S4Y7I1_SERRU|nr:restriction endonuclease subunit S [Serratia rubidaea]VEI71119.1 Type I restriction enzyme EcoKI specificity protein [Serratia rubidaea]